MKISLQWTNDFVGLADDLQRPQDLADVLTKAGLEVEEIVDRRKDFEFVVTGLILEKEQHPNADRLSVCKVTTGEGVVHQIVCGATNHRGGDRVVVALPGAILPGNFEIKRSAIRGVESGGMLCSLKELGLATESDGIEILPKDAPIGRSFADYAGLSDVIFELKVTPNRADCLSHFGLAREIACLRGRDLIPLHIDFPIGRAATPDRVTLEVLDQALCPRYCGRVIQGLRVGPSPDWLKKRLESVGLKSINNVVDVTNYVMMELGQPLHAFDVSRLSGRRLSVGSALSGEKFKSLDGTDLTLKEGDLVIRDAEKVVALAGVVGGLNSGVSEETTEIFLESASFQAMTVRRASRAHGIETDSAYRFSRGVDPEGALRAMDRATQLILQVAGGEALDRPYDTNPRPTEKAEIEIKLDLVTERLGYAADEQKFVDFMRRLGCELKTISAGSFCVLPPSFRFDLEQDMDLIEEYARLNGYDQIPEAIPVFAQAPAAHDEKAKLLRRVHGVLRAQGALQAWNYGFVGSRAETAFIGAQLAMGAAGLPVPEKSVRLRNPLSDDLDVMRSGLSFGLFRNLLSNVRHGNDEGFLYEIGSAFASVDTGYREVTRFGLIAWGRPRSLWTKSANHPVIFDLKAAVEALLEALRITSYTWLMPSDRGEAISFCHPGQFAQLIVEGKKAGFIGTLHPVLLAEDKIQAPAAIGEFDMDLLLKGQPRPYRADTLSKFPAVERDFAFLMPRNLRVGDVLKEIRKAAGSLLVDLDVFDVYEGEKLEMGQKSVAIRLVYQDKNATLQDAQIQEVQSKILNQVEKTFGIRVR